MERRGTIFDFIAQVFCIFGFTMLILMVFCAAFGDSAKPYSTIFALGSDGIPAATAAQYFLLSVLIAAARVLFFTDRFIREMALWLRGTLMLGTTLVLMIGCILLFGWFPMGYWQAWMMFFICFTLSFVGSLLAMTLKEKTENRQLEEALRRIQKNGGEKG